MRENVTVNISGVVNEHFTTISEPGASVSCELFYVAVQMLLFCMTSNKLNLNATFV